MSEGNLNSFIKPVEREMDMFHSFFRQSMKSSVGLVELISRYIIKQKGKKIRPILVLLSAKTVGEINESTFRAATLVELMHTATLVHDDVVDEAETRRGFPSINAVWKNKIAVLMGDFLLARGLLLSVNNEDFEFLKTITDSVKRMSEGELLQISKTRKLNNDIETYFRIISDKTASLFSTCTSVGAFSSSKNIEIAEDFKNIGENIGIAFQIKDDIFDFSGNTNILGKPVGTDLKEKKLTLPLLAAFQNSSKSEIKKIKSLINKNISTKDYQKIIDFVNEKGGLKFAEDKAKEFIDNGVSLISKYPDSESKAALISLSRFIIERKK